MSTISTGHTIAHKRDRMHAWNIFAYLQVGLDVDGCLRGQQQIAGELLGVRLLCSSIHFHVAIKYTATSSVRHNALVQLITARQRTVHKINMNGPRALRSLQIRSKSTTNTQRPANQASQCLITKVHKSTLGSVAVTLPKGQVHHEMIQYKEITNVDSLCYMMHDGLAKDRVLHNEW